MKNIQVVLLVFLLFSGCKKEDQCNFSEGSSVASVSEEAMVTSYLSNNNITTAVEWSNSGMYYIIDAAGNDKKPGQCSSITIKYTGKFSNGTVFDQTSGNNTATFTLGELIEGWKRGLPRIGAGGKIKLYIPPTLGYGSTGVYNSATQSYIIPPNSMLIFDIEMISISN